LKIKLNFQR